MFKQELPFALSLIPPLLRLWLMTCSSLSVFYCLTNVLGGENGRWWKKGEPLHAFMTFRSRWRKYWFKRGVRTRRWENDKWRWIRKRCDDKSYKKKVEKLQMKMKWWEENTSWIRWILFKEKMWRQKLREKSGEMTNEDEMMRGHLLRPSLPWTAPKGTET